MNGLLALAAYWKRALSPRGMVAAVVVGAGIGWGAGLLGWALLGVFFLTSTGWSRYRGGEKQDTESLTGKTGRRDALQVMANGGPALACAVAARLTGDPAWIIALAASLAEANADTWASEAGLLSRVPPRSILGFRPLPRGASGGVTLRGTLAAAAGSCLIALALAVGCALLPGYPRAAMGAAALVAATGFAGSIVDSVLGASVQGRFRTAQGVYTERARGPDGGRNPRIGGIRGVSNDVVNLASSLTAAAAALLAARAW